ncbi:MAG TPA: response regulator [Polyangiaceae bacterium]
MIDDEPLLGRTLGFMLEENHDVVVAASGADGLQQLARDDAFDLVLCDLDMPGVNGGEVHETMRTKHPHLMSRFVLMSGGACTLWAEEFIARYSGQQLEKPFTAADVERVLQALFYQ